MTRAELTADDEALLVAEGWTLVDGSAGDWRDPYTRDAMPGWRALELVRRDVGGADPKVATRRATAAAEALHVTVCQFVLEVQRRMLRRAVTPADIEALRHVTDRIRDVGREVGALCEPRKR